MELAPRLAPRPAPIGSTNAKAEPSTKRGSVRLDRRRIIRFKGSPRPAEGKVKAARRGRNKTHSATLRHNSVMQHHGDAGLQDFLPKTSFSRGDKDGRPGSCRRGRAAPRA